MLPRFDSFSSFKSMYPLAIFQRLSFWANSRISVISAIDFPPYFFTPRQMIKILLIRQKLLSYMLSVLIHEISQKLIGTAAFSINAVFYSIKQLSNCIKLRHPVYSNTMGIKIFWLL